MKIIIDIPRAKYNTLRNDSTDHRGNIGVIYRAVQNGTVLPENHGDLPSVNPQEPKTGHWIKISPAGIYECSECGQNVMTSDICAYKFCHGCGAKMVEPQETETWNGYHGQITAPKGTFKKIYEDAESENKE